MLTICCKFTVQRTQQVPRYDAVCRWSRDEVPPTASDAVHDAAPSVSPELPSSALSTPSRPSPVHAPPAEPSTVALNRQTNKNTMQRSWLWAPAPTPDSTMDSWPRASEKVHSRRKQPPFSAGSLWLTIFWFHFQFSFTRSVFLKITPGWKTLRTAEAGFFIGQILYTMSHLDDIRWLDYPLSTESSRTALASSSTQSSTRVNFARDRGVHGFGQDSAEPTVCLFNWDTVCPGWYFSTRQQ